MRLAEEEKLRKEMSAKRAKEEAERKHQVSPLAPAALHLPVPSRPGVHPDLLPGAWPALQAERSKAP